MDAFSDEFILMNWFDAKEKLKKNKISLAFYGSQPGNISEMLSVVGKSIDGAEYADTCGIKTFHFAETERKIIIATAYAKNLYPYFRYIGMGKNYCVPFGIYHAENPPSAIKDFLRVLKRKSE